MSETKSWIPYSKMYIRPIVRGVYQVQKLRIAIGLRIVAAWKVKAGQEPSQSEGELSKKDLEFIQKLRDEYDKITDGIAKALPSRKEFAKVSTSPIISDYAELVLCHSYFELLKQEEAQFVLLKESLKGIPIWDEFLSTSLAPGVGPAIAGIIISEIDITKCTYVSSLWKYLGLDVVVEDNRGRGRYKEHLVPKQYVNHEGETVNTMGLSHNAFAKSKIVFNLGSSILRAKGSKYSQVYYEYKNRLQNHPKHMEKSAGHIHAMARRYAIKRFLSDLYDVWRKLEGCPVHEHYEVAKLGIIHKKAA